MKLLLGNCGHPYHRLIANVQLLTPIFGSLWGSAAQQATSSSG